MSASLSPRPDVAVLPSLPPSPSLLEEVFSYPRPWSMHREELDPQRLRRSHSPGSAGSHTKGKRKQSLEDEDEDDEGAQHRVGTHEAYPPTTDEAAETRRVEETLKRWELAERQRRKTAREVAAQHTSGPSLLSSVTRAASLVLRRSASIGTSAGGTGGTRALKSHESVDVAREGYAVPLDDINHSHGSSGDVAVHSPSPSVLDRSTSLDASSGPVPGLGISENPFVHPSERAPRPYTPALITTPLSPTLPPSTPPSPSPFADAHAHKVLQADPTMRVGGGAESKSHVSSCKRSSRNGGPFVLSPRPLGLPLPPSPVDAPHAMPLRPTPRPILRPPRREDVEDKQEVRWWHDWLCGCGEGPDRGGDNQAGRTNPFE